MNKVKFGIAGFGAMGRHHAENLKTIPNAELAAVSDVSEEALKTAAADFGCKAFSDYDQLLDKKIIDAVLIATPHFNHTPVAVKAFERGIHVLCEKPVGVHINDINKMIQAHKKSDVKFAAMFQLRIHPVWKKVKQLMQANEIGQIMRTNWITTDWFRSQIYYDAGKWRATWAGEGGGVLLNQCPHHLDLFQWLCGMPSKLRAYCHIGKHHHIEVEDEVTAYLEYPNGATGVFIASTGEAPGTNRLEITGELGKIIIEKDCITLFQKNSVSVKKYIMETDQKFTPPDVQNISVCVETENPEQKGVVINFINSILNDEPLIASGDEGLNSVMLSNAMLYSSFNDKMVELPLNGDLFETLLRKLMQTSCYHTKQEKKSTANDFLKSLRR